MDVRLLAGVDVPGGIFRAVSRDHSLSHEKGSEAPGAADAWGTDRREGADSENHHGFHVAGIYRPHRVPRTRSSLRMVAHDAVCGAGRGCAGSNRLARHFSRLQGKYFY